MSVIMSLSSQCISTAAQHILQNTHTVHMCDRMVIVVSVSPCSSDHDRGTFLPQNAQLLQKNQPSTNKVKCVCVFPVVHHVLVSMALSLWFSLIWASVSDTPSH